MKKAHLLSYGVMVGIAVCLGEASLQAAPLAKDLLNGVGLIMLVWLYEQEQIGLRSEIQQRLGELKHIANNALTVILYVSELQPKGWKKIFRESLGRVREALNGVDRFQHQDCTPAPDCRHKMQPQSVEQGTSLRKAAGV